MHPFQIRVSVGVSDCEEGIEQRAKERMYAFPTGDFGTPVTGFPRLYLHLAGIRGASKQRARAKKTWAFLFGNFRIAGLEARIPRTQKSYR